MKRSIRTMIGLNKFDSVKPFYEKLKILPLTNNAKHLQFKFMWKLVNAVHPKSISDIFPLTYNEAINNHQNKFLIPNCNRAISEKLLACTCYKLWNQELPINIKSEKKK